MKVFVNDIEVKTYYGAKVKSAVMAFLRNQQLPIILEGMEVRDQWNNVIDMNGSIRSNSKIYVKI